MLEKIQNLPQRKIPDQTLKLQEKQMHAEHVIAQEKVQTAQKINKSKKN